MSKTRTRKQYRLTWSRATNAESGFATPMVKTKNFASIKALERHVRIMTSDEPWREWKTEFEGLLPEDYACCPGGPSHECGCGGYTNAEVRDEKRKDLPPILWIKQEVREITSTPFTELSFITFAEEVEAQREI